MSGTIVRMARSTIVVDGTNKYQIQATCDVKGTLPDTSIFLLQINNVGVPKDDTLIRVVDIADTLTANTVRATEVSLGNTVWRSNALQLQYGDIETANAAWKELSGRINTLVKNVDTYLEEFETGVTDSTIVYPTTTPETEQALINSYLSCTETVTAATEARNAQEVTNASLKKDLDVVIERLAEASADLAVYGSIYSQLTANLGTLTTVRPTLTGQVATLRSLVASSSATPPEQGVMQGTLLAEDAQLITFGDTNASLATLNSGPVAGSVATLQGRVATLTSQRNTLTTQYNAGLATVARLQGKLDAARETCNQALADVRAVCPTYAPPT
jgi:hypothetical protein